MRFDCHMHTHLCGHATGRPEDYVKKAKEKGIDLITFTCHVPMEGQDFLQEGIRMSRHQLPVYKQLVQRAREAGELIGVQVLMGIEAEVFPDNERISSMETILDSEPFDFVLGSLHHPLPAYRRWLGDNGLRNDREIIDTYFEHLTEGAKSGNYHSMSHPDVIRIYGTVDSFHPEQHDEAIHSFLQALVYSDVCMEVNTSGLSKGVYIVHPDPLILKWAKALGVNLTLGSDAHRPDQVGQHFTQVLGLLEELGFESLAYFQKGTRIDVKLEDILTTS